MLVGQKALLFSLQIYESEENAHRQFTTQTEKADSEVYLECERDMQLASQTDSNYNNHNNLQTAS